MNSQQLAVFCEECGSVLPRIKDRGDVQCFECSEKVTVDALNEGKIEYTVTFNPRENFEKRRAIKLEDEGPIVEKRCPKCDNETMSYATLQLRSADEGQTVFFTCTKCKYKYNENS